MKNFFSSGILLFFICAAAGGSLALVYQNTKPLIQENARQKRIEYRKSVLPKAKTFKPLEDKEEIFLGYDENDSEVGMAIISLIKGYSDVIEMIIGSDIEGRITGVKIVKHSETPGLGANIEKDYFLSQFKGLTKEKAFTNKEKPDGAIDVLSGATISTDAVLKGIRQALNEVEEFYKSKYNDGTFESKVRGKGGLVQVQVKVTYGKIVDIKAIGRYEAKRYWKKIKNKIIPAIIEKQDVKGIDTVTGATYSSKALLNAVNKALEESKKAIE